MSDATTVIVTVTATGIGNPETTATGETTGGMTGAPATKTIGNATTVVTDADMMKSEVQDDQTRLETLGRIVDAVNLENERRHPNEGHLPRLVPSLYLKEDARPLDGMLRLQDMNNTQPCRQSKLVS